MADYGVTSTGFNLKRLEDIKADIETALRGTFGEIDTSADSVFGQLIGVLCSPLSDLWEQAQNVYNAMYPASAEGVALDRASDYTGAVRLAATKSSATLHLRGADGTVVPVANLFSQSTSKEQFETLVEATIEQTAVSQIDGVVDTAVSEHAFQIEITGVTVAFTSGVDATKAQIAEGLALAITAETDLSELVTASYVAGDEFFTVRANDVTPAGVFNFLIISTEISTTNLWVPVAVEATQAGRISVPQASINTIDNSVQGLDEVSNFAEGTVGRDLETDGDFRIRRRASLGLVSAGTLSAIVARLLQDLPDIVTAAFIFENPTGSVDADGRPGHSFETVVAFTDTEENRQAIAEKIWERKPAGILAYGDIAMTVQDGNGTDQLVSFTKSSIQYAHLRLTYDRTGSDAAFPTNGETLIAAELQRLGETLSFGSDILVQKFQAAGYVVQGVTSVLVEVAVTAAPGDTPTYQSTNLAIATADLPSFDLSRITVQEA